MKTLDSGNREHFETGARRDTQDNKPRYDLIPLGVLHDLQHFYGGAWGKVITVDPPITGLCPEEEVRRDLIPDEMLNRLGGLYHRGALKYDDNNWKQGIPLERFYASLFRHLIQWASGDTSEDHISAVIWNATGILWTEHAISRGELPLSLADAGPLKHLLAQTVKMIEEVQAEIQNNEL